MVGRSLLSFPDIFAAEVFHGPISGKFISSAARYLIADVFANCRKKILLTKEPGGSNWIENAGFLVSGF